MRLESIISQIDEKVKTKTFQKVENLFTCLEQEVPDLLICDYEMPIMNGLEVCKKLRKDQRWNLIPIMLLSSKSDEDLMISLLSEGADFYVNKTLSTELLISKIKALLRLTRLQREKIEKEKLETLKETILAINHEVNNSITAGMGYLKKFQRKNGDLDLSDIEKALKAYEEITELIHKINSLDSTENYEYVSGSKMLKV